MAQTQQPTRGRDTAGRRRPARTALAAGAVAALALAAGGVWGTIRSAPGLEGPGAAPDGLMALAAPAAPPLEQVQPAGQAVPPPTDQAVPQAPAEPTEPTEDELENLDPELRRRFEAARDTAAAAGITLELTSGWRSPEEQQALVDAAVATHGSAEEARRWVLPPEVSEHVAGRAVDVGPQASARWLEENAGTFGLCRTYENEWWHFEAMPDDGACPPMRPDSSWGW